MANKKPTLEKVTSSSNVINDFEKFNWQKDVNKGRLTNNEIETTKHLYRKRYIAISAVIIGVLFVISASIITYLWFTWGDDHTLNEYFANEQIDKNLETVQTKYDEMKNKNSEDFTNNDTPHLVNRLNHYTFFKSEYLTNNPNDFYNNFSRKYSSKYTNFIKDIDDAIAETKTNIKNNMSSDINSITYDSSLFNSKGEVKEDIQLLASDIYKEQISDLQSKLETITCYQNMYNLLEQDDFTNLTSVYSDKFEHIKALFIASLKQETQTQSSDEIKKAYEDEYNKKLKEIEDTCNSKITEKETKIKELEKEIESLKKNKTSSSDSSSTNNSSSSNNTTNDDGYEYIRVN